MNIVDSLLERILPTEDLLEKDLVEEVCKNIFLPGEAEKEAKRLSEGLEQLISKMLNERNITVDDPKVMKGLKNLFLNVAIARLTAEWR